MGRREKKERTWQKTTFVLLAVLGLLFLLCSLSSLSSAAKLVVDDDAPPGGDGSRERPFSHIQDAIDNATSGDIITIWAGNYHEWLELDTTLTLVGNGSGETTVHNEEGVLLAVAANWTNVSGISFVNNGPLAIAGVMIYADNVTVADCLSTGSAWGIHDVGDYNNLKDNVCQNNRKAGIVVNTTTHSRVTGNNCSGNQGRGISVYRSDYCLIRDNVCWNNNGIWADGITLTDSYGNTLENNSCCYNQEMGIEPEGSSSHNIFLNNSCRDNGEGGIVITTKGNVLRGNLMSGNGHNFKFELGSFPSYPYQDTIIDDTNLVDGKPIYFLADRENITLDAGSNAGLVYLINCRNMTVKDLSLDGNHQGIYLHGTHDSVVENVSVTGCQYGIMTDGASSGNLFRDCQAFGNYVGLFIYSGVENTVMNSSFHDNDFGMGLYHDRNQVTGNLFTGNIWGIKIAASEENRVEYNNITGNKIGIFIEGYEAFSFAENNLISHNNIRDNTNFGINATSNQAVTEVVSHNWWGSASGPYHPTENPNGTGDNVTDFLDFKPWLTLEAVFVPEPGDEPGTTKGENVDLDFVTVIVLLLTGISAFLLVAALASEAIRYQILSLLNRFLHLFTPTYTRLGDQNIEQDIERKTPRGRIYNFILDNPGTNFSTIYKELAVGIGTAVYHLSVLQRAGYVRSAVQGNYKLFWTREEYPGWNEAVTSDVQREILSLLEEHGGLSRTSLMEKMNLSKSTLHFNLRQLAGLGLIVEEKRGKKHFCSLKK